VRVVSNDELGYTGDIINEMAEGLEEGERLRHSLALAREVQQSFLPSGPPAVRGLDVAGRSVYCDETGGDYYDYLIPSEPGSGRVGLVVGDVSDHGLQSALLMILARTSIRHHAFHSADPVEIVSDVNVHLAEDFGESGHFMTLFLAYLDTTEGGLTWINAGHDPALLYCPAWADEDDFVELSGRHPALGLSPEVVFTACECRMHPGQVLVMGTDGIWETENEAGECFGKERLKAAVRRASPGTADEILSAVFADLESFGGRLARRDDVTLVVAKAVGDK
jgi:sigma-B regulation protein RsbU (phosphoserine phosphatase)